MKRSEQVRERWWHVVRTQDISELKVSNQIPLLICHHFSALFRAHWRPSVLVGGAIVLPRARGNYSELGFPFNPAVTTSFLSAHKTTPTISHLCPDPDLEPQIQGCVGRTRAKNVHL